MRFICLALLSFFGFTSVAQVTEQQEPVELDSVAAVTDPYYREDQFYASISYNLLQDKPSGFSQNSFSTGITAGFLRDIPINEARTRALAIGLGYSYNNLQQNLKITKTAGDIAYEIVDEDDFSKNKLVLHYVELPLEYRWRNSNATSHKFWRIYTGVKVSYLFADKSVFESNETGKVRVKNNPDLNKLVYGVYVSAGWNTWNLYAYYGLNPIFDSPQMTNGENIRLNSLNLGLMFYIL